MSSGDLAWRPLPLSPSPDMPVLLVSAEMGAASYTVRVTDMANIWVESLQRKAICTRGWSEDTSIDPSDTPENMARFLASLKSALDSSQPGHDDTSLYLSSAAAGDAGDDGITLRVTCTLPGLAPLRWPIHLSKAPPSTTATDLVLPLVQAHYARKRQVESLLQALGHKDAVLAKLSDKLEAMGIGLEHVFTAFRGRKKVTRSVAENTIKGLAPFDLHQWKAELDNELDGPNNTGDLVQSVFGDSGLCYGNMMEINKSPALDGWWHDSKGTLQLAHRTQSRPGLPANRTPLPPEHSANAKEDDEFQVQIATPSHFRSAGKRKAASSAPTPSQVSTAGEDEDGPVIPQNSPLATVSEPARQAEPPKTNTSQLGAIGGKKPPATPRSSVLEARSPRAKVGQEAGKLANDSETASEASDDNGPAPRPHSSPPLPSRQASTTAGLKKRGGLGTIGGRAPKASDADKANPPEAGQGSQKDSGPVSGPVCKKLGVIGNKIGGGASPSKPVSEDAGRGRIPALTDEEHKPRETSQERADRRREELKRDLQKKAAAGPARKRRRF